MSLDAGIDDSLVCAPNCKVDVPLVELDLDVAHTMCHVEPNECTDLMRLLRDGHNVEQLTSVVLHERQPYDSDL